MENNKIASDTIKIYFRNSDKTLGKYEVESGYSHSDSIDAVKQNLVENKKEYSGPILACIKGGKL